MSKPFTKLTAGLLFIGAAVHALRLITCEPAILIAGHNLPQWENWPAGLAALLFGFMLLREARR